MVSLNVLYIGLQLGDTTYSLIKFLDHLTISLSPIIHTHNEGEYTYETGHYSTYKGYTFHTYPSRINPSKPAALRRASIFSAFSRTEKAPT